MYSHYESQQKEIETIKPRQLEIKLSDADVLRVAQKAGAHGLTVAQLIENFIGDLVGGTYSNGSDERMYAEQWFERCWFSIFPDMTFLRYLTEWGGLEDVLELWGDLQEAQGDISYYEEHPDEPEPGEVEEIREVLQDCQEQINEYWNAYLQLKTENEKGTFDACCDAHTDTDAYPLPCSCTHSDTCAGTPALPRQRLGCRSVSCLRCKLLPYGGYDAAGGWA